MRRILIVPVIAGILLTMSACGAKEETSTTASTQASAKSSDQSSTTEKKSSTTDGGTTDGTEDDRGSGKSDLPSGLDNDCIAISTLYVTVTAQATALMTPGAVSAEELEELDEKLEEARSEAEIPDEIAEDFETWSAAWAEFGTAMQEVGSGGMLNPANAAKIEAATKIIEDPEVEAAGKNIEAFVTENCVAGGLVEE